DALDGHLARTWQVVSRFGRVMDPFADKLLILGTFVMLAHPRFWAGMHVPLPTPLGVLELAGIQGWMGVAILARELLVTSLRGVYESDGVDFSATLSGKVKMVLQCVAAPIAMLVLVTQPTPVPRGIAGGLAGVIWLTIVVTLLSGLPYGIRALRTPRGPVR
ncbi:MAG: CDP-alcohol phosphatidyltransferase family protein, partial [Phycisphaerales bacterium]|nr:CDP-alcohol phosphatidyltransferase family protein [Phycisphaerales bacterium]